MGRNGRRDTGVRLAMLGAAVVTGAGFIGGRLAGAIEVREPS